MANESMLARRRARLAENVGGAVYGAIVVTAVIAAMSHHEDRAAVILASTGATIAVFWLAHVYAAVLSRRFEDPSEPLLAVIKQVMVHELPMLEIAILPCAILGAAHAGWLGEKLAVQTALYAGVLELFAFGVYLGRKLDRSLLASLWTGLFYAATGGVIVVLKAAIH